LTLSGVKYCFTKTDAVYVWTKGRYNIGRYRDFYPIFIKIKKESYPIFLEYCKKLDLKINSKKTNSKRGVFYNVEILDEFNSVKKDEFFVEPLDETINFIKQNIYNFQPALEMINEMYNKGSNTKYKEVNYL
jgi:hypothetical protein